MTVDPREWQEYVPTGRSPSPWAIRLMRPIEPSTDPEVAAVLDETTQTSRYVDGSDRQVRAPADKTRVGTETTPFVDED